MKPARLLPYIALTALFLQSSCSSSQKTSKKEVDTKKPDWVMSRPVDRSYYQGIGVAMVNNYTQGHVEEAKKKALNDLTSEISVTVKSTTLMQQVERNEELNSMYQNLTKVTSENNIEGYELVASWGDEKEYWVYYRLSKSLYSANKQRKLDRAAGIGKQYYDSGKKALAEGSTGRAYEDFVKGLTAVKEYIDAELTIESEGGQVYLADVLFHELIELNRNLSIQCNTTSLKARISQPLQKEIQVTVSCTGKPMAIPLRAYFSKGNGEVTGLGSSSQEGTATLIVERITGGEGQQVLEISPDIEGMTAEIQGQEFMAKLIRLKSSVPSAKVTIESQKITAFYESDVVVFGQKSAASPVATEMKGKLSSEVFVFTENRSGAEVFVKFSYSARKGEQIPLKDKTLYTAFVDLFVTVTEAGSGKQVFYKGITGEKGSRAGDFDKARMAAEEAAIQRFEKEILPEIGSLDL